MIKQTEGIVLISRDGYYVNRHGRLPTRPEWDKSFLLWKIEGKRVLCSAATDFDLPPSVYKAAQSVSTDPSQPWDINLGIATFEHVPDVFYLCKSHLYMSDRQGKKFRLDFLASHVKVFDTPDLTIYVRRKENG